MIDKRSERRTRLGEFYTPIDHARKALEYIRQVVGEWWQSGEYRLWDMAAGTGNLEHPLPHDALQYCYISTLRADDADYCKSLYRAATVFQYDYLNDGEEKLPANLRADLDNPDLKWIVFINPPYVTANNPERGSGKTDKNAVSMTAVRKRMTADGMGLASRELFAQFLYRIDREFRDRRAMLCIFSKIKYINANNDQRLRDKFFDYEFERGFVFSSRHFQNTKGNFPIGFLIWNLARHIPLSNQKFALDILDDQLKPIGVKTFQSVPRGELINNWFEHPPCRKTFPPFSSALTIGYRQKNRCDRIADGFLASLMSPGNDMMHQNKTALLSGPYVSAGAFSITPENFECCMVVHAVRRLPKATWLNDRDQFTRPSKPLPVEFVNDCVVWSLFAGSNCTAAISDVEYEGKHYRIKNELYPWSHDGEERFAAKWLSTHDLSSEASAVLDAARSIRQTFYARLNELDREKYRLETWDVGWYQVRRSLEDANLLDNETFRAAFDRLSEKLLPQIYSLGFLRDEVVYFD